MPGGVILGLAMSQLLDEASSLLLKLSTDSDDIIADKCRTSVTTISLLTDGVAAFLNLPSGEDMPKVSGLDFVRWWVGVLKC